VQIVPAGTVLARAGTQVIQLPSQVLADGFATPLEAALLLGHHSVSFFRRPGERLALFIVPQSPQPDVPPQVLLAWTDISTGSWHALDMRQANVMAFAANEALTTPRLRHVLQNQQDIVVHLERRGVFAPEGQSVVALDFTRIAQHALVDGLP
jgi:hypothetical protein